MRKTIKIWPFLYFIFGAFFGYSFYQFSEFQQLSPPQNLHPPSAVALAQTIDVCFSPEGNCEKRILAVLEKARTSILVQAYSLTSQPIARALIQAKNRGVHVRVLCDKSQLTARRSILPDLKAAGIHVTIDPVPGLAHNKIIMIDGEMVLTGSYNFTQAANKSNAENLLLIRSPNLTKIYEQKWHDRFQRAIKHPYGARLKVQENTP